MVGTVVKEGASVRRYWLNPDCLVDSDEGKAWLIQDDDFKHICIVCRQDIDSKFEILSSDGHAYFVKIVSKNKKSAMAQVLSVREVPPLPQPYIELCISVPKFKKLELIIEKSVELGVHRIHPFFSEFSFIRDRKKMSSERVSRLQKIVKSATQQSGRGDLMDITSPCTLDELLLQFNQNSETVGLFPYEGACDKSLKQALSSVKKQAFKSVWAFIGSEGGFSEREVSLFREHQLEPVTLGEQVLRVETACLSIASILKYELVDS